MPTKEEYLAWGFDRDAFLRTPWPTTFDRRERTYLYLFECAGYFKVGIAADVEGRRAHLMKGNPLDIASVRTVLFPSRLQALMAERAIHQALSDTHHRGEWFAVDRARVGGLITVVCEAVRVSAEKRGRRVRA